MRIDVLLNPEYKEITFGLFNVGRYLGAMGSSWFLSCLYNELVDSSHRNFEQVGKSLSWRLLAFGRTHEFHKVMFFYIKETHKLSNLAKNTIDLSMKDLKSMINALSCFYDTKSSSASLNLKKIQKV